MRIGPTIIPTSTSTIDLIESVRSLSSTVLKNRCPLSIGVTLEQSNAVDKRKGQGTGRSVRDLCKALSSAGQAHGQVHARPAVDRSGAPVGRRRGWLGAAPIDPRPRSGRGPRARPSRPPVLPSPLSASGRGEDPSSEGCPFFVWLVFLGSEHVCGSYGMLDFVVSKDVWSFVCISDWYFFIHINWWNESKEFPLCFSGCLDENHMLSESTDV